MFYYNVDLIKVINGEGPPPSVVSPLIQYMPPGSACESVEVGAPDMVGYDISARLLADISDWSQATWLRTGEWDPKKKRPTFTPTVRPWVEAKKRAKRAEGADIGALHTLFMNKSSGRR